MDKDRAWQEFFQTGNREPVIKAYWKNIEYIARDRFKTQQEDMFQWGMIGLLKALDRLDRNRVKNLDAWVYLNVRGMMLNAYKRTGTQILSLDAGVKVNSKKSDDDEILFEETLSVEEDNDTNFMINEALKSLPSRDRVILRLIFFHDWRRTEIGRLLGISSMRVGQLEKRALNKLKTDGQVVKALL